MNPDRQVSFPHLPWRVPWATACTRSQQQGPDSPWAQTCAQSTLRRPSSGPETSWHGLWWR